MIYFITGYLIYFIFDKIKNKVVSRIVYNGIKLIKYSDNWHKQQSTFDKFCDWVLL